MDLLFAYKAVDTINDEEACSPNELRCYGKLMGFSRTWSIASENGDRCQQRTVSFCFGLHFRPLFVCLESAPLLFSVSERLPTQHVAQIAAGWADQIRPEPHIIDAMALPYVDCPHFEASHHKRKLTWQAVIHAQLVEHLGVSLRQDDPSVLRIWRITSLEADAENRIQIHQYRINYQQL